MARLALIGTRVRDRRLLLGIKQSDLARDVGISPAYLNLIEHNRRRIGPDLGAKLAGLLEVEPAALTEGAEGALFDMLREASAGVEPGIAPEIDLIEEFVGRYPGWAGLLAARQRQIVQLSRSIEGLSERMAQDPFLATALHEVLTVITSVRSTSAILTETEDIEPEWQMRFLRNIHDDSLRLTTASAGLAAYLDQTRAPETGLASPQEEVEAWLEAEDYHFAGLERSGAVNLEGVLQGAADLISAAGRELALDHLRTYQGDVQALPLAALLPALGAYGANPVALAKALGRPMPLIFRRLASLPPDHLPAGLGLVGCDGAGTLTFRRAAAGFLLPRFGAACSLWPLYEALVMPGTPIRRIIETVGRGAGARFAVHAWCDRDYPGGFDGPAVSRAWMLIVPLASAGDDSLRALEPRLVGASCRICPKADCVARREPSILT